MPEKKEHHETSQILWCSFCYGEQIRGFDNLNKIFPTSCLKYSYIVLY